MGIIAEALGEDGPRVSIIDEAFGAPSSKRSIVDEALYGAKYLGKAVVGAGEVAANLATQAYGLPAKGYGEIANLATGRTDLGDKVSKALIYEPQTESGKAGMATVAKPFEWLHKKGMAAGGAVEGAVSPILGKTAGEVAGTTVASTIEASPLLLGEVYSKAKSGISKAREVAGRTKEVPKTTAEEGAPKANIIEEALGAPSPEKGLFPGQDEFRLTSPAADTPIGDLIPDQGEQALIPSTEKAYRDVGMREKETVTKPPSKSELRGPVHRHLGISNKKGNRLVISPEEYRMLQPMENGLSPYFTTNKAKGGLKADKAAQEMYGLGLISDPSLNGIVEALQREQENRRAGRSTTETGIDAEIAEAGERYLERQRELEQEQLAAGPGAKTAGTKGEAPSDMSQLTQAVSSVTKPTQTLSERIGISQSISAYVGKTKDAVSGQLDNLKGITAAISDAIAKPSEFIEKKFAPQMSDYKGMLGDYLLSRTRTGIEASKFAREINRTFSKGRQEAMRKWYLADGDIAKIKEWMDGTKDARLKKMYKDALTLTQDELRLARNIKQYHDAKLIEAQEAGVLGQGVENYLRRMWKKENPITKSIMSEINAGMFRKNPSLLKKRFYESEFAAETGPKKLRQEDYRIGYSVTSYDIDMNEALATRAAIRKGFDGKASDGRPLFSVSGSGKQVLDESGAVSKYVIRPKTRPEEAFDYRIIDHPAMREWKWVENDETGKPILLQGGILVHPEIYPHLKNVLGKSAVMQNPVFGPILRGAREFKNTLLSLSGFHQVQIGIHSIFHKVNPFHAPEINLDVPSQARLVSRGLQVYSPKALSEFGEGLYSSGVINKLPGVGPISQKYGSYLFEDYIPRQKMQMALAALERNIERYKGKLSIDQIYELTANQANAAFAEQNYKWMGRHPTTQDIFRIMALAPDFLEARMRFVGQAITPYGKEQAAALIRGAAGMYIVARVFNQVVDGDPHWDKYFSLVFDGKEYALRSIPGDLQHLFTDPRSFVYWRLNPATAKPLVEALTGRDAFGRERTFFQQVEDYFTGSFPIPLQGLFGGRERTVWQSLLSSMGASSWKSRSAAEKLAGELSYSNMPKGVVTDEHKERMSVKSKIKQKLQDGDRAGAKELANKNGIDISGFMRIEQSVKHPLSESFRNLSPAQAVRVWEKATTEERKEIRNTFYTKVLNDKKMTREDKIKYIRQIKDSK
jgi:hypothetical protein